MSYTVEHATYEDVPGIVSAHLSAFPGHFLTLLGPRFLAIFYRGFLDLPLGTLLVAHDGQGAVLGALAGTGTPADFFRRLRARRGLDLILAAVPSLLRHPLRVVERLLSAARYGGDQPPELPGYWLLSSLGVRVERAGAGIGGALVARFIDAAREQRATGIYLVTDTEDNDSAKRFYGRYGFVTHSSRVRRDGRRLSVLVRSLT